MSYAIMLDIETMGQRPTSAMTSIAAVWFSPLTTFIGEAFHMHVSLESCLRHGLIVDADTLLWWMQQSDEARNTLAAGQKRGAPLQTALAALAAFIPEDAEVWCNGNSFDFPILANAYHVIGKAAPWKFWNERDLRTLKGMNRDVPKLDRSGTHHNALDDARHQARLVQHILQCQAAA